MMKILNAASSVALAVVLASGLTACNRGSQPKTGDLSPSSGANATSGTIDNKPTVKSAS
jgi:hypothetical protein